MRLPRVCIVTGSRADKGPLSPLIGALDACLLPLDPPTPQSQTGVVHAFGGLFGPLVEALTAIKPDLVVLLGDRYEILAAAFTAYTLNIPIAHLSGGDLTEGSQDDGMRHAITKLSHLHFPTNALSALRIHSMGEEGWRVHMVGCPGIDQIASIKLLSRTATLRQLGICNEYYLVAYQPATLLADPVAEAQKLCEALSQLRLPCVFTSVGKDAYGVEISRLFNRFCQSFAGSIMADMPQELYLSAMKHCKVMIGNSSSGLYEAPTLKKAFVNVGERQTGRIEALSVVSCEAGSKQIANAVRIAECLDCSSVVNPYGDGKASERIKKVVQKYGFEREKLLFKKWTMPWPSIVNGSWPTDSVIGGPTQTKTSLDGYLETLNRVLN